VIAYSDRKALTGQQIGDGSIKVSTWCALPEDWIEMATGDMSKTEDAKRTVVEHCYDWDPRLVGYCVMQRSQSPAPCSCCLLGGNGVIDLDLR
jgi:hypothetical protein